MDIGETIFQGLLRAFRRFRDHRAVEPQGAVLLGEQRERWTLVASLLSRAAIEIKPAAQGGGGVMGDALLLPQCVSLFPDKERNCGALLYRIAYASSSRALGMHLWGDGWDGHARYLATLLAVPATRAHLEREFPGSCRERPALEAAVLGARPEIAPTTVAYVLEGLTRRLLGKREPFSRPPSSEVVEALDHLERLAEAGLDVQSIARQARAYTDALARKVAGGRGEVPPPVVLWGELMPAPGSDAPELGQKPAAGGVVGGERRIVELDRTIHLTRRQHQEREDKPLYHMFEKIETAEDYGGESGTPDDSGDVRQMQDAVQELSLGTAIRSTDDPRNLVRAEVLVEGAGLEVAECIAIDPRAFRYPEWDARQGRYREDWCTVFEERYVATDDAATNLAFSREIVRQRRRQVDDIRAHLLRALFRRETRNRQTDGPEIDVEAMVERHADLVAGHTPPERMYLSARKAPREIAILLLLDSSFSTDAWVEGRRVMDIEIEALLILADAFEGHLEQEVAVASFHSQTRKDVRFGVLKGFEDSWAEFRRVAPGLRPQGYTRIGAAVRHGTAVLDAARARHKLLLLVSDGKPTDYDRYEGRHGIEDVAQAVREAHQKQVHTFGLAIEKEAKLYLARMLGPRAYRILPRTSMLADVMAEVFVGVAAG